MQCQAVQFGDEHQYPAEHLKLDVWKRNLDVKLAHDVMAAETHMLWQHMAIALTPPALSLAKIAVWVSFYVRCRQARARAAWTRCCQTLQPASAQPDADYQVRLQQRTVCRQSGFQYLYMVICIRVCRCMLQTPALLSSAIPVPSSQLAEMLQDKVTVSKSA